MFELSVACKYLIPRRRQLSVSIISLISVLVIALVVWLIVVFFSVTDGLEKSWIQKLTALTAPVRITPTEAYYHSYYYQVDSISEASGYSHKTIREKKDASIADPYNPEYDEEIPAYWPAPDRQADGSLKNLVQLVYSSLGEITTIPGLTAQDFELTASHIRLRLMREMPVLHAHNLFGGTTQSSLSYPTYLGNLETDNPHLERTLLPIDSKDLNNLLQLLPLATDGKEETNDKLFLPPPLFQKKLKAFFTHIIVTRLQARSFGWTIPRSLLPEEGKWVVCAICKDQTPVRLVVPGAIQAIGEVQKSLEEQGLSSIQGEVEWNKDQMALRLPGQDPKPVAPQIPLTLAAGTSFSARLIPASLEQARRLEDVKFDIEASIQNTLLTGLIPYRGVEMATTTFSNALSTEAFIPWLHREASGYILPRDPDVGEGIVLPKSFKDAGVLIGDRGFLSYFAATASLLQEQLIPVYVAGFYDPGIIPIGGKFILANPRVTSLIRASHQPDDKSSLTNGINVRFDRLEQADAVKEQLLKAFKDKGISRYWNVETYREYEFTKEIIRELQSQKNIFLLIAIVIIVVACSNIISMLVILVNDKKVEIGILRSMGASSKSIALIFGLAGAAIGIIGSVLGIGAAIFTLQHLGTLISLLSRLQGYDMFNASFYGDVLPHELSYEALLFVLAATCAISLLAGIVPAVKACLLRPSHILRSTGG
ncbi:ABC transporter permease [Candidatus Protochlamydia phocaeensis]|uniref:ABC transporter permease n=1 Tax=Candidatus Protochlamydia phocaeensis TaxID=1414722 RepID=UPI000839978A|nr:FtsX-like permease family protein [Candidatus Protochlamydia phocaeensis]